MRGEIDRKYALDFHKCMKSWACSSMLLGLLAVIVNIIFGLIIHVLWMWTAIVHIILYT
jgi:hypothetical protein